MSIITGLYTHRNQDEHSYQLHSMMEVYRHYPSDTNDIWIRHPVGLGCHNRWITPEAVGEQLPLWDDVNQLAITADGMLDNREELFSRLSINRTFLTTLTDSQLILMAYRRWGKLCPRYLTGDYSFVIWDEQQKLLFGARDLMGNRTLYYQLGQGHFSFSTAIKPLLQLSGVNRGLDESYLAEFLLIPWVQDSMDPDLTIYRSIKSLPPGHCFTYQENNLQISAYEQLLEPQDKLKLSTNAEYEEAFRHIFKEAVSARLRTFRQVGASLSGGLDSGTVVSFAAKELQKQQKSLHTYSSIPRSDFQDWTYRDWVADESPHIKEIAAYVGNVETNLLPFADRNAYDEIDDLLDIIEAPYKFYENSTWLKGIPECAAADGVGILLNGARGNYSISFGPAEDYYALLLRRFRWLHFYQELKLFGANTRTRRAHLVPYIGRLAYPRVSKLLFPNTSWTAPVPSSLISPDLAVQTRVLDKLQEVFASSFDEFEARREHFGQPGISHHYGTSRTKFSLKYGVMERDPTDDPRVIRFCLSLPYEQLVQDGMDRSLIRRATNGYLPDSIRFNQSTRGIQGADWLHRLLPSWQTIREEIKKLCKDSRISSLLNTQAIQASLDYFGPSPKPEYAYDPNARLLMTAIVVSRFLQRN